MFIFEFRNPQCFSGVSAGGKIKETVNEQESIIVDPAVQGGIAAEDPGMPREIGESGQEQHAEEGRLDMGLQPRKQFEEYMEMICM